MSNEQENASRTLHLGVRADNVEDGPAKLAEQLTSEIGKSQEGRAEN